MIIWNYSDITQYKYNHIKKGKNQEKKSKTFGPSSQAK